MKLSALFMLAVFAAPLKPSVTQIANAQEPGPNRGVQEEPVSPEKKERRALGQRSLNPIERTARETQCSEGIAVRFTG
jgi:hypothetical protein